MNRLILVLILMLVHADASGAETVKFWVEAPDTLEFGKKVTVTYHLYTNDFRDVEWPRFTCFKLDTYYFPSYESYSNKTRFRDFEWKMEITPMKSGQQMLPSMGVMANGRKINSEEKDIFVKGSGTTSDALMLKALQKFWTSEDVIYEPRYREKPPIPLVNDYEAKVAAKCLHEKGQSADNIWLKTATSNAELVVFSDDWNACFAIVARQKYEDRLDNLVLAYSMESNIGQYDEMVKYYTDELKSLPDKSDASVMTSGKQYQPKNQRVDPLLGNTAWGQGAPYNSLLPTGNDGKHIPAGAGAVAMAQVMHYHQFPANGLGKHYYKVSKDKTYGMDFSKQTFDWSGMRNEYEETDTACDAASVIAACAYALETDSPKPGNTKSTRMKNYKAALTNFFGYDTRCAAVEDGSNDLTISLLYSEIDNKRPVICRGASNVFVADGYDGTFFHLNMGYSRYLNGYYRVLLSGDEETSAPLVETLIVGIEPSKGESLRKELTLSGPGTLSGVLSAEEKSKVTHLKVSGELNAEDMKLIRVMAGALDMKDWNERPGSLEYLDLGDASFVTGKNLPYMQQDASGYTYTQIRYISYNGGTPFETSKTQRNMGEIGHDEWKKLRRQRLFKGNGYKLNEDEDSKYSIDFTLKKGFVSPYLFSDCDNLKEIILPQNTKSIEDCAFAYCNSLTDVTLPKKVSSVTEGSFMLCYNLQNVYYQSKYPTVKNAIHGVLNISSVDRLNGLCDGVFAGNNSATCNGFQKLK